jgi:DNA polymerase-3 subunit alpha
VRPPDVNESEAAFTVGEDGSLRCGLGVIKNVGLSAIASLVEARRAQGRFAGIRQLCRDVDLRLVNRKVCESLIKAGGCDSFQVPRAAALAELDQALEEAAGVQQDRLRGQFTFFEALTEPATPSPSSGSTAGGSSRAAWRDWPESQKLAFEKALLGFYVSGHPLARHATFLNLMSTTTAQACAQAGDGASAILGGMLTKIKLTTTKKTNEQMAVCLLEDLTGDVEVVIFPNSFSQLAPALKPNSVVFVEGRVTIREDRPRLIAQQILPIEEGGGRLLAALELVIRTPTATAQLEAIKTLLATCPGRIPTYLRLELPQEAPVRIKLPEEFRVEPKPDLLESLMQLLGEGCLTIKRQPPTPPRSFAPSRR